MKNIILCVIGDLGNKRFRFSSGAAFISAVLKENGFTVTGFMWDTSLDDNEERLKTQIVTHNAEIVMCSGYVYNYTEMKRLFETAKSVSPSVITVQGGGFVTNSPKESMVLMPDCDIGVIGEGEITVVELVQVIERNECISSVKSIVYRNDSGALVCTEKRAELPDLSALPIPDYEGIYGESLHQHKMLSVTTGRGCNYACTFCSIINNKKYRARPLEKVFEELDYYTSRYDWEYLYVTNEYFDISPSYLDVFCACIGRYKIPILFNTRISDELTVEVLRKLKAAGVQEIFFGIESADDAVLKSMRKNITVDMMIRSLTRCKEAFINVSGYFIIGDTAENDKTVLKTLDFVRKNRDLFQFCSMRMIRLYPGSFLYNKAVNEGKIEPLSHIANGCPEVNVSQLSDEAYNELQNVKLDEFLINEQETDLNIADVSFMRKKEAHQFDFKFSCTSCGKVYEKYKVDVKRMAYLDAKIFCGCGEKIALDFYGHIIDSDKISQLLTEQPTAFYGMSRIFYKIYYMSQLKIFPHEYWLLNQAKQRSWLNIRLDKEIHPPPSIEKYQIKKVIVTLSGHYDLDGIVRDLSEKHPKTEFIHWYEV